MTAAAELIVPIIPVAAPQVQANAAASGEPKDTETFAKLAADLADVAPDATQVPETGGPGDAQAGDLAAVAAATPVQSAEAMVALIAAGLDIAPATVDVAGTPESALADAQASGILTAPAGPAGEGAAPAPSAPLGAAAPSGDPATGLAPGAGEPSTPATTGPGIEALSAAAPGPAPRASDGAAAPLAAAPPVPEAPGAALDRPAAPAPAVLFETTLSEDVSLLAPEARSVRATPVAVDDGWAQELPVPPAPAKDAPAAGPVPAVAKPGQKGATAPTETKVETPGTTVSAAAKEQAARAAEPGAQPASQAPESLPRLDAAPGQAPQAQAAGTPAVATAHHVPVVVLRAHPGATGPALSAEQIAVAIARQIRGGVSRFEIRLDPPELGRIDVRLDMGHEGRVAATLLVDRPETLDLLARDARSLQRLLTDAGLQLDQNGLHLGLREGPHRQNREQASPSGAARGREAQESDDAAALAATHYAGTLEPGRIDLRV